MKIGVLALQGNFREHAAMLRELGADVVEVRLPEQLGGLDGLVIPGGESTAILRLARLYGLEDALRSFAGPILGTCAGMILVDRAHLGLADLEVDRNGLRPPGRELRGGSAAKRRRAARSAASSSVLHGWRARGDDVEILAEHDGEPVLLRDGRIIVAAFHPELTDDTRVHERFLDLVREEQSVRA